MATLAAHVSDPITIGGQRCSREEAPALLASQLEQLSPHSPEPRPVALGIYRGLRFGLILYPQFAAEVYLQGAARRHSGFLREHQGPRAVFNAIERLAGSYETECARLRQDLAIAESQLRDYQACLGKPFLHDGYWSQLTVLRDQLRAGLSGQVPEPGAKEALPSVCELAQRIKALKAAHTIQATPLRMDTRRSNAEKPVTTRILLSEENRKIGRQEEAAFQDRIGEASATRQQGRAR
jgi:hypothetical protein